MSRETCRLSLRHLRSARLLRRLRARVESFNHGSWSALFRLLWPKGATESRMSVQVELKMARNASVLREQGESRVVSDE